MIFLSTTLYKPVVGPFMLLNSTPWFGYTTVFNHSSTEGLLSCLQFGVIINKDATNVLVCDFTLTYTFHFGVKAQECYCRVIWQVQFY